MAEISKKTSDVVFWRIQNEFSLKSRKYYSHLFSQSLVINICHLCLTEEGYQDNKSIVLVPDEANCF